MLLAVMQAGTAVAMAMSDHQRKKQKVDHRTLPRGERRKFRHDQALACIKRDYLGPTPLFGADFKLMFRISLGRFQVLMEDIMNSHIEFFRLTPRDGVTKSSLEAKLLLPLKTLAYGVPPHTFTDYFQMSKTYADSCCDHFAQAIKTLYMSNYLRLPTATDVKRVLKLHKAIHNVDGLIGSLDCTHTYWKNCPKAWQQSYKGKEDKPSIAMEAVCDFNLFFWHTAYGYTGACNDLIILSLSPLLDRLLDGSFEAVEEEAGVLPFEISGELFDKLFFLGAFRLVGNTTGER